MKFEDWLKNLMTLAGVYEWHLTIDVVHYWKMTLEIGPIEGTKADIIQKMIDDKIVGPFEVRVIISAEVKR